MGEIITAQALRAIAKSELTLNHLHTPRKRDGLPSEGEPGI